MNATPEATDEYSTGDGASRGAFERDEGPARRASRGRSRAIDGRAGAFIFALAIIGALLLAAAEFSTLYQVHLATKTAPIQSVTAGSHNSYAMLPIAALAAVVGFGVWRAGNRLMLLAIGVLGVIALLIAVLHDLPDAHAVGLARNNSVSATTTPNLGLFLETAGSIVLIAAAGLGFALARSPRQRPSSAPAARREG